MKNIRDLESLNREELMYLAKLSEQTERYDEMIQYIKAIISKSPQDLPADERTILYIAYKNPVSDLRTSWRVINSIEKKEERRNYMENKETANCYKKEIEQDIIKYSKDILEVIEHDLIPKAASSESRVFYYKMKGDYGRYMSEITTGTLNKEIVAAAEIAYTAAYDLAKNDLPSTHPTRLGLALNFSVFYNDILEEKERAIEMAKGAFDEAISELENISEENSKDSTLTLHLIKDNLNLWNNELNEES